MMIRRKLINVSDLTPGQKDRMFNLMDEYYNNVTRQIFERDLSEKQYVILLECINTSGIEGFSTQMTYPFQFSGKSYLILYSGDTIISRKQWGSLELPKAFGELTLSLIKDHPGKKIFWFLITKGARTYKFLPVFFKEFYPRYDSEPVSELKALTDALAADKFGHCYDSESGVISANGPGQPLKEEYEPEAGKRDNPHVSFFYRSNPDYKKGEELACIAELSVNNISSFIRRVLKV
jgi:hypothetical protein